MTGALGTHGVVVVVLNMDRLLSTVLLALTLAASRRYLLVDGADQPMSGTTHAPSLPQGKYGALSPACSMPRTTHEHLRQRS